MNDWTGSSSQRREQGGCPVGAPCMRTVHRIAAGTPCLVKKASVGNWLEYTTKEELEFNKPHRTTDKSYIYTQGGWLLCVQKQRVSIQKRDGTHRW